MPPAPTRRPVRRFLNAALLAASSLLSTQVALAAGAAAQAGAKPAPQATKKPAAAPAAKPSPSRAAAAASPSHRQLANQAKGLALAKQTVEQISAAQLEVAASVLTGAADCEFKQQVHVHPVNGQPGYFQVAFQNRRYTMVPQETQTGAVRLEDKQAGVVWLQIPAKSMLMDGKRGQRLVDSCQHAEQRIAVQAAAEAGQTTERNGLGITQTPAAPAAAPTTPAAPEAPATPPAAAMPAQTASAAAPAASR